MAQTIKLKRSAVSGNTPSTTDLELGEIAINTYDGKVFIKKDDGSASVIEVGADKGQIIHYLENAGASKIVFVGDKSIPGGNDWGIIRQLEKSNLAFEWYQVRGPEETLSLIRMNKVFDGGK